MKFNIYVYVLCFDYYTGIVNWERDVDSGNVIDPDFDEEIHIYLFE